MAFFFIFIHVESMCHGNTTGSSILSAAPHGLDIEFTSLYRIFLDGDFRIAKTSILYTLKMGLQVLL
ncbi:hypothetical protein BCON_0241g00050 [Botryotinia convoluta]|uniref:Uncharacterized protein n=1 Tax=Botryotinia convoluta TaxID=54673 RepID=A0A4Z1HNS6_9HELO|nr:hypothetical protein BCON_0241g00050 [Botryotinia convoluta]